MTRRKVLSGDIEICDTQSDNTVRCILGFHAKEWNQWGRDAYKRFFENKRALGHAMKAAAVEHQDEMYLQRRRVQWVIEENGTHHLEVYTPEYQDLVIEQIKDFAAWIAMSPSTVILPLRFSEITALAMMMSPKVRDEVHALSQIDGDLEFVPKTEVKLKRNTTADPDKRIPTVKTAALKKGSLYYVPSLVETPAWSPEHRDKVSQALAVVEVGWDVEIGLLRNQIQTALNNAHLLQGPSRGDWAAELSAVIETATQTLRDLKKDIDAKLTACPPRPASTQEPDTGKYSDHPLADVNWDRAWAESVRHDPKDDK
ncbi:MAG: hypothetical protein LAT68_16065 [Cyclobacteriaceae bacterium]|nr:hypothetical protein [Cyclobacteriaceae bacterium]